MLRIDHLAISCTTLSEGVAATEARLGVTLAPGGAHPDMATHNRLLNLGDLYLEVIAPDPAAPRPAWPRWFDLDHFAGPPRLTNWVAACDDLDAEIGHAPEGIGRPVALSRGEFNWRMAVPADGRLPFDGGFPALIAWQGNAHPARHLPDVGLRLTALSITHPDAEGLRKALLGRLTDPRLAIVNGPQFALTATISTANGALVQI